MSRCVMELVSVLSAVRFSNDKMQKVNLFETSNLFCDAYCLRPGQGQKPHTHQGADKIYYVLQGEATVQIGSEKCILRAGQIVLAPSDTLHGVENTSQSDVTLLVIMAPNPNREHGKDQRH